MTRRFIRANEVSRDKHGDTLQEELSVLEILNLLHFSCQSVRHDERTVWMARQVKTTFFGGRSEGGGAKQITKYKIDVLELSFGTVFNH